MASTMASSSSSAMRELRDQISDVVRAFINSYDYQRGQFDIKSLSSTLHPSCVRYISPGSGRRNPISNQQYEAFEAPIYARVESRRMQVLTTIVDVDGKAAIHTIDRIIMQPQYGAKSYAIEMTFTLFLRDDGDGGIKIWQVKQFVDPIAAIQFNREERLGLSSDEDLPTE